MKIPDRLATLLGKNQELDGIVKTAISRFEPWIKNSHLPFFPEYTDHGPDHLEEVLATASSLITDAGWEVLTPGDAAVTVLSTLLHDCAMHLTEDGFCALLEAPWRDRCIEDTNDRPWHVVWEEFLGEASRFDGKKLRSLFGDGLPARRPPMNPNEMSKRDRLLIGEFLRRHHPRLAQEIIHFGVPGPHDVRTLTIADFSQNHVLPIAGIVARSHGAPLRQFLTLLESRYGRGGHRECSQVHPTFQMTLLRIADYLQVQAERAPRQVLSVKHLASPVSRGEWQAHSAIFDIRQTMDDPEALHIEARPTDVRTFFRVKEWVTGIQAELDESWAVLGEVYGRYAELSPLGLVLRRVRSNIEDSEAISKSLDFLPRRAAFRAADADLLKLLIGPLYGDDPAIGMRELIQNAIDAVRELNVVMADRGQSPSSLPVARENADVVASIEKDAMGQHWVIVSDGGLGMTADVIVNYFLTAGASFRRSDDWRKSFETADGKSRVLRAGRFGVGALAAFLLGNAMHVTTRHVDSPDGIAFSATVETEFIELRKCERLIGTTIRIPVTTDIANKLCPSDDDETEDSLARQEMPSSEPIVNEDDPEDGDLAEVSDMPFLPPTQIHDEDDEVFWDWYCFSSPLLKRIAMGAELKQRYAFADDLSAQSDWNCLFHPDYDAIFWTYSKAPTLACNGIVVPQCDWTMWHNKWGLEHPNLHVRDSAGRLPLNLQRSELQTKDFPFSDELGLDVCRNFCAFALATLPLDILSLNAALKSIPQIKSPHLPMQERYGMSEWFFTKDGIGFLHPSVFEQTNCGALLITRFTGRINQHSLLDAPLIPSLGYMCAHRNNTLYSFDAWIREITTLPYGDKRTSWDIGIRSRFTIASYLGLFEKVGLRILIPEDAIKRYIRTKTVTKTWDFAKTVEWTVNGWSLVKIGECSQPLFAFEQYAAASSPERLTDTISECYFGKTPNNPLRLRLADEWLRIFGQPLIPSDPEERRVKLKAAYDLLEPHLATLADGINDT